MLYSVRLNMNFQDPVVYGESITLPISIAYSALQKKRFDAHQMLSS